MLIVGSSKSVFISVKIGVTFLVVHSMSFSENFAVVYRCLSQNSTLVGNNLLLIILMWIFCTSSVLYSFITMLSYLWFCLPNNTSKMLEAVMHSTLPVSLWDYINVIWLLVFQDRILATHSFQPAGWKLWKHLWYGIPVFRIVTFGESQSLFS